MFAQISSLKGVIKAAPSETKCIIILPSCIAQDFTTAIQERANNELLSNLLNFQGNNVRICLYLDDAGNMYGLNILPENAVAEINWLNDHPDDIVVLNPDGSVQVY